MAASVEGAFIILDRASSPMRKMEEQAKRTDKAIKSLGDTMDEVGTSKQLKQLDQTNQQIKNIDRDATRFSGSQGGGGKMRSTMKGLGDDSDGLTLKLGRLSAAFSGLGKIMNLLKFPAIVAGIGVLIQGVGALAGGVVALLPKLTDLVGVLGAAPVALTALIGTMSVAKLAFAGMGDAIEGDKQALAGLTAQAREMANYLRTDAKNSLKELRAEAQRGFFGAFSARDLQAALSRAMPTAQRFTRRQATQMGGIANRATQQFTSPAALRDVASIGDQATRMTGRFGRGLINVAQALRHIAVAAEPFTDWLGNTVEGWTKMWREQARVSRGTGELRGYFNRARDSLERFGSIASNLWGTFRGLGRAARPLGEALWRGADRATASWERYVNSVQGRVDLRRYFDSLREPLREIGGLTSDLAQAIARMSASPGLARTVRGLRGAVEPLERLFTVAADQLGPAFGELIANVAMLVTELTEGSGVLTHFLELLNMIVGGFNELLGTIPGLSNLIGAALATAAVYRMGMAVRRLAMDWMGVAGAARTAGAAQTAASGGGIAGAVGGGAARGGAVPLANGGGVLVGRAGPMGTAWRNARAGYYSGGRGLSGLRTGAGAFGRGVQAAGLGGTAMGGLRAAGKLAWPAMALFGAMDFANTEGGVVRRAKGAVSGATMGLIPAPKDPDELQASVYEDISGLRSRRQMREKIAGYRDSYNESREMRAGMHVDAGPTFNELMKMDSGFESEEMQKTVMAVTQLRAGLRDLNRQMAQTKGQAKAMDLQEAFGVRTRQGQSPAKAMEETLGRVPILMRKMGDEGSRVMLTNTMRWARQVSKGNPAMQKQLDLLGERIERRYKLMGRNVEVVNGRILTGTRKEWAGIRQAIGSEAERARQEASDAFTKLQQQAIGSLTAMGFDSGQARKIVEGLEAGGSAGAAAALDAQSGPTGTGQRRSKSDRNRANAIAVGAKGMRIPGSGTHDTVPLVMGMAAPGELIVNRHTEERIRQMYGVDLGAEVAGEKRPHHAYAKGGMISPNAVLGGAGQSAAAGRQRGRAAGGASAGGGSSSAMQAARQLAISLGLSAGEGPGTSSGHATGSLHYSGLAWDVSGAAGAMREYFLKAAAQFGGAINELFYDPMGYYYDEGRRVAGAIGGHSDHVHIGFFPGRSVSGVALSGGGAGAAGGMGAALGNVKLRGQRSGLKGVPGAMAQRAMDVQKAGLEQALNKKVANMGGAGAMAGGATPAGGVRAWLSQALRITGHYSPANLQALYGRAMQESGGDPNAINNWDSNAAAGMPSQGLLQTIPPTFNAYKMRGMNDIRNPVHNAVAAIRYMFARYGHIVGPSGSGYEMGGRIPEFGGWFGNGGDFTAHRPTLIGVGDGGSERVRITPSGRGGGDRTISIGHISVQNNRPGDIKKQVKEELHSAFKEFENEINGSDEDDPLL